MRISDWSSDVCSSDLRQSPNAKIPTGQVEVVATAIEVLNKAEPLPFHAHENAGEDIRLRYRYLDLRTPEMQRKMRIRTKLVGALRRWLDARGFQDIETPILTKATPEGARDFLRSEEPTSELQSLIRISYAAFCLKKKQ